MSSINYGYYIIMVIIIILLCYSFGILNNKSFQLDANSEELITTITGLIKWVWSNHVSSSIC